MWLSLLKIITTATKNIITWVCLKTLTVPTHAQVMEAVADIIFSWQDHKLRTQFLKCLQLFNYQLIDIS